MLIQMKSSSSRSSLSLSLSPKVGRTRQMYSVYISICRLLPWFLMFVTFVAASLSPLNWPCHRNEHLKMNCKNIEHQVPGNINSSLHLLCPCKKIHFNGGEVKKWFHEHIIFSTIGGHSSHEQFTRLGLCWGSLKAAASWVRCSHSPAGPHIKIQLKLLLNNYIVLFLLRLNGNEWP